MNTVIRTSNGASSSTDRSGIAYFVVTPSTPTASSVAGSIANQGYVALGNNDNAYFPSIGVNAAGKGVMTFSMSGHHYFPSAAYTSIDAVNGAGPIHIAAAGARPDRRRVRATRPSAATVSRAGATTRPPLRADDGSIWIATEFIPGGFGFPPYLNNWGTFVGNVTP